MNGWRWKSEHGMVFGQFFHDVKFITEAEAKDYEKQVRAEFKKEK